MNKKSLRKSIETDFVLKPITTVSLPLPAEKIKDLQSLLLYIHPNSRQYYDSFLANLVEGNAQDSEESEDNDD